MKTQHTQGPWKFLYDSRRDNYQIYADRIWIATTKGDACSKSQEANARLIAAAPLLLEACEDILLMIENKCLTPSKKLIAIDVPFKSLKQAIKKAKGEI